MTPLEAHIHEWLNLLIRWIHMIVGIAWIGASFYFNWLENRLDRSQPQEEGIAGNLWAIHGGGFYHLKKFQVAPPSLPVDLHWFKWEAYTTWLSGMVLLFVVYYFNSQAFMLDPSKSDLDPSSAIALGLGTITISWLVYHYLCKSALRSQPLLLAGVLVLLLACLAWQLDSVLSSRAAYIHVGAAIGTIMVANVFFVIIPGQLELVTALKENRQPDASPGKDGLLRSRHNNYLTLPVLFIMISHHFPSTYGNSQAWMVLVGVSLISVAVRHYFNIRHMKKQAIWILPAAMICMVVAMLLTAPKTVQNFSDAHIDDVDVMVVVNQRCTVCHSSSPTQAGFSAAPGNIMLDTVEQLKSHAPRVLISAVTTKTMPLGNLSAMTEEERTLLGLWLEHEINHPE